MTILCETIIKNISLMMGINKIGHLKKKSKTIIEDEHLMMVFKGEKTFTKNQYLMTFFFSY